MIKRETAMEYSHAISLCLNGKWHSVVNVEDRGSYLEVQVSSYEYLHVAKKAVDAVKFIKPS